MKADKTDEKNFKESSNKKLDEIIKQSKLENEALKKLLEGLEKLEKENEARNNPRNTNKNINNKQELKF